MIGRLYETHSRQLLRFFMRRVYDAEAARDLTAETFAQALIGERRFRGDTPAEEQAWLYAIARRQLARYLRKGHAERRAIRRLGVELSPLSEDDYARIEELAGTESIRAAVAAALAKLGAGQRIAVRLRVIDELPYPVVAERLGVSEQTARARVSRALRSLAVVLDGHPDIQEVAR